MENVSHLINYSFFFPSGLEKSKNFSSLCLKNVLKERRWKIEEQFVCSDYGGRRRNIKKKYDVIIC